MSDKKLSLRIAEHDLVLELGANYLYKFCKEATGIDMIEEGFIDIKSIKFFDYVIGFVYGGYAAECKMKREPIVHKPEDIEHWVMSMNQAEVADIFFQCSAVMSGKSVDELKKETAQAANGNGQTPVIVQAG